MRIIFAFLLGFGGFAMGGTTYQNVFEESQCLALADSLQEQCKAATQSGKHFTYTSSDSASLALAVAPTLTAPNHSIRDRGHYLRWAGTHWLISLGLGLTGAGLFLATGPEAKESFFPWMLVAGAVGFQIMVPIDLILAGSTD